MVWYKYTVKFEQDIQSYVNSQFEQMNKELYDEFYPVTSPAVLDYKKLTAQNNIVTIIIM